MGTTESGNDQQLTKTRWQALRNFLGKDAVIYTAIFVFAVVVLFGWAIPYYRDQGEGYVNELIIFDYDHLYNLRPTSADKTIYEPKEITLKFREGTLEGSTLAARLAAQLSEVRNRERRHLKIIAMIYPRYYMGVAIASGLGFLAAFTFVLIGLKGWRESNKFLVFFFIMVSSFSAYFALFPTLYQQPQNIDNNEKLYRAYASLENEIRTFALTYSSQECGVLQTDTQKGKQAGKVLTIKDFIDNIDIKMSELNRLTVTINHEAVKDLDSMVKSANSALNGSDGGR